MTKIQNLDQVVDAGAKVFAAKGFEAARLEDIAAELEVLQGSLYHHISSKAELLLLIQERRLLTIVGELAAIAVAPLSAKKKLEAAIRAHMTHIATNMPESTQWFTQPPLKRSAKVSKKDIDVKSLYRRYVDSWTAIMDEGIATGEFRSDLDSGVTSRAILGICNWLPRWYQVSGRMSIDDISHTVFTLVCEGASAPQ